MIYPSSVHAWLMKPKTEAQFKFLATRNVTGWYQLSSQQVNFDRLSGLWFPFYLFIRIFDQLICLQCPMYRMLVAICPTYNLVFNRTWIQFDWLRKHIILESAHTKLKQEPLWCCKVVEKWVLLHFGKLVCPSTDCVDRQCQSESSAKNVSELNALIWSVCWGKGKGKIRKLQTILRTILMIYVMNVVCGFELREEQIQFYIWLRRRYRHQKQGDTAPPSLHISSQIYLSISCICICTISMDNGRIFAR